MDVVRLIQLVRTHLSASGQPFALAGAFALNAYGLGRETHDLDLIVPREAQAALIARLEELAFKTLHASEGYSNHLHADGSRLDFIYVDRETGDKLFSAARFVPFIDGEPVRVPRPEHLIALKVHAIKNDPSRRYQDLADIAFLLRLPGIDAQEARGYFARAGLREDWDELQKRR
ncbi:MAG: nucleotidyl transferase AbiEii/AbiGii toxin family protein [Myxococcaceae bacterium]|nr:nucleotidyl transferase AbiEii/AbiGii toxin family protein [Myxococcaceae bacterium]